MLSLEFVLEVCKVLDKHKHLKILTLLFYSLSLRFPSGPMQLRMAEFHAVPALALYSSSKKKTMHISIYIYVCNIYIMYIYKYYVYIMHIIYYYCNILSLYEELACKYIDEGNFPAY